ncbi:MAG: hypothetical protein IIY70_02030, partial [Oscillospiraceae bacterium]|nr:hypothetical protein [Oscillospiraceae bacterium]
YGLDDIFLFRILWKLLILPVFVVMPNVSFPVAIFCILSELVCFIICMKKKIGKNTVAVLKGE